LAADTSKLYWVTDDSMMSMPLDGGLPKQLVSGNYQPSVIAVDATSVFWVSNGGCTADGGFAPGTVGKVPKSGGPTVLLVSPPELGSYGFFGIALDADNVYWTVDPYESGCDGGDCSMKGGVMSVPKRGGASSTVVADVDGPWEVAVDASRVYWATSSAIKSAPLGGGTISTLASGYGPTRIAVDSTRLYWTDTTANGVLSVPVGGGNVTTLWSMLGSQPQDLALDSTSVYWVNNYFGGTGVGTVLGLTPK
jgi:hypothetical protein